MSIHATDSNVDIVAEATIDLATAQRLVIYLALEGGTDNYFIVTVPGYTD